MKTKEFRMNSKGDDTEQKTYDNKKSAVGVALLNVNDFCFSNAINQFCV